MHKYKPEINGDPQNPQALDCFRYV